jgi:hypothetical protein
MVDLRLIMAAAGCLKIAAGKIMDLCGVIYPDRISQKECRCAFATVGRIRQAGAKQECSAHVGNPTIASSVPRWAWGA